MDICVYCVYISHDHYVGIWRGVRAGVVESTDRTLGSPVVKRAGRPVMNISRFIIRVRVAPSIVFWWTTSEGIYQNFRAMRAPHDRVAMEVGFCRCTSVGGAAES